MGNVSPNDSLYAECIGRPTRYRGSDLPLNPELVSVIALQCTCGPTDPMFELMMEHGDAGYIEQASEYLSTRDYQHASLTIH